MWNHFGLTHKPSGASGEPGHSAGDTESSALGQRVLTLINRLTPETTSAAIDGIAEWLFAWETIIANDPITVCVWLRIWPLAASSANKRAQQVAGLRRDVVPDSLNDLEATPGIDTLNNPVGKLIHVLLARCPTVQANQHPFETDAELRAMRDIAITGTHHANLIAKCCLIESLHWFMIADPDWSEANLLAPLRMESQEALALWKAAAWQPLRTNVLKIIGKEMVERAMDTRLRRKTRDSLIGNLVVESLNALRDVRSPAVPHADIQQMLRSLDDEARAQAAGIVEQFTAALSPQDNQQRQERFRQAAVPFLKQVWPQERSLATPGVAAAFAKLPRTCGTAFVNAVNAVERFLVPFECWSMSHYGFYGEKDDERKLRLIDHPAKAKALLRLLDNTVGTAEGAVFPMDLGSALEKIRSVSPTLADESSFRRLAALTRR